MAARPESFICAKCGCSVDPKTATTLTIQRHWLEDKKHWRTGCKYVHRRSESVQPSIKFCEECETKVVDMMQKWLNEDGGNK